VPTHSRETFFNRRLVPFLKYLIHAAIYDIVCCVKIFQQASRSIFEVMQYMTYCIIIYYEDPIFNRRVVLLLKALMYSNNCDIRIPGKQIFNRRVVPYLQSSCSLMARM